MYIGLHINFIFQLQIKRSSIQFVKALIKSGTMNCGEKYEANRGTCTFLSVQYIIRITARVKVNLKSSCLWVSL